jgi:Collagen triple helix repeat (20 copies)
MKTTLTAAIVAALVAAISATAGTALIITSKNIKNGTIQAVDMSAAAKQALKGNRGSAGPAGPAGATGTAGPPGAQGIQGVQGSPGLSGVEYVVEVGVEGEGSATAWCPEGKYVIGGGGSASVGEPYRSEPTNSVSWTVSADAPSNVTAIAICANLAQPPAPLSAH